MIGSLLTATYRSHVSLAGVPARLGADVKASFAVAAHLPAPISDHAQTAFMTAMHVALLAAAGVAIAAAIGVTLLMTRTSPASQPSGTDAGADFAVAAEVA